MLHLCNSQKKCLLLETASRLQASQTDLRLNLPFGLTVSESIAELIAAKRAGNRREVYLKSLSHYLARFALNRELTPVAEVTTENIEHWLAQFPLPYSRQTWLNRISTLFSFAVRRGHCDKNPCDRVERITIDRKPPKILTPDEAEILLAATPMICRPYLILGMFAGVRPDELMRLSWDDVDLETATVRVDGKTRRRRIVPLEPKAVALLAACPLRRGSIAPSVGVVRSFKRAARAILGWTAWHKDVLRHTAASYALALHRDAARVALALGNSEKILMSHYIEPVSSPDCGKFWKLTAEKNNITINTK